MRRLLGLGTRGRQARWWLAGLAAACASSAPAAAGVVETGSLRVLSGDPWFSPACASPLVAIFHPEAESNSEVVVSPLDPQVVVASWQQGLSGVVVASSVDGARTWSRTTAPLTRCSGGRPADDIAGDARLAYGSDGTLYMVALAATSPRAVGGLTLETISGFLGHPAGPVPVPPQVDVVFTRSADNGRTWSPPAVIQGAGGFNDRPAVAVDPRDPRRVHAVWARNVGGGGPREAYHATSGDAGVTWGTPARIPTPGLNPFQLAVRVLPGGSVVAAFIDEAGADSSEMSVRSQDRGATWSSPVRIGSTHAGWPTEADGDFVVANPSPSLAVDRDGALYAAWHDVDPTRASTAVRSRVRVARSVDAGRSWEAPQVVVDGAWHAYDPTIAADRTGAVAVTWYDTRRDTPETPGWSTDVRAAHTHGNSGDWSETHVAGPFDATSLPGTYFGLAAARQGFVATFTLAAPIAPEGQDIFATELLLRP